MKRDLEAAGAACVLALAFASGAAAQTLHVKINCGDNSYTPAGWEDDDAYVTGGTDWINPDGPTFTEQDVTGGVANAAPLDVYKSVRHIGPHSYDFPASKVPDGTYIVRFHFIDKYAGRSMSYFAEGVLILDNFDITSEAGGPNRALVKDFDVTVSDGDGLQILCEDNGNDVFEAGIEIMYPVLTSVVVTPDPAYCLPSQTVDLAAEVLDQYGNPFTGDVTWSVTGGQAMSPTTGATSTFQSDGTEGTFVVTASATDGTNTLTDTADVTVAAPRVTTVNVTPQTATIGTGGTQDFTAEALDQFGAAITATVTWTVSGGGTVAAGPALTTTFTSDGSTEGTFTVTATADDGTYTATGTADITVSDAPRVTTMTLTPAAATIAQGDTQDYTVTTIDQFGAPISADVTFSIEPVAGTFVPVTVTTAAGTGTGTTTFTADGTSTGIFTVTATSGSATATAELVIIGSPALTAVSISSDPDPAEIATGGSVALTAVPVDQFGQPFAATVTWTVSGGGSVSPTTGTTTTFTSDGSDGTFTVMATADGQTGTARVTVTITPPEADYDLLGCRAGGRAVPPVMLFVTLFLLALRSERSRARRIRR